MKFESGISYLDRLVAWDGKRKFTLEANLSLLRALGSPQNRVPAVHVAGTNGKGTVCAQLAAMLHASGKGVGQYLSPHLNDVNERCLIDGRPVAMEALADAVRKVEEAALSLRLTPSFFEAITAAAFVVFADAHLDWMVIEVGLGGRLDATNAIESPHAAVIASISLDHTQTLGNTIAQIAREKAGIFKSGTCAFVGRVDHEAREAIADVAREKRCPVEFFGEDFTLDTKLVKVESKDGIFPFDPESFRRRAAFDQLNTALSVRVAQFLGLSFTEINRGLQTYRWPGRLEVIKTARGASVLFDIAHNPDGINALLSELSRITPSYRRVVCFISILHHKDWGGILKLFRERAEVLGPNVEWVFIASDHDGAVGPETLQQTFGAGRAAPDADAAFREELDRAGAETLIIVTGSLFIVGKLRPALVKEPFRSIVEA